MYDRVVYCIYRVCRCVRLQTTICTPYVYEFGDDDEWNNLACNLDVDEEILLARSRQSSVILETSLRSDYTHTSLGRTGIYVCAHYCTIVKRIQIICKTFVYVCVIAEFLNSLSCHCYPLDIPFPVTHLHSHTLAFRHVCACNTLYDFQTHTRVYVHRGTWCVFTWYFGEVSVLLC